MTPLARVAEPMFAEILSVIREMYYIAFGREANFIIADSSSETKFSRHIVISGVYVQSRQEAAAFTKLVHESMPLHLRSIVDWGVNKRNQCFRLPGCAKA